MIARLYYEAHITVEARTDVAFDDFAKIAREAEWRASRFSEDEVDDMSGMWFLSVRYKELDIIKERVRAACKSLTNRNYNVLRWKIEDTVLDSKHGDKL